MLLAVEFKEEHQSVLAGPRSNYQRVPTATRPRSTLTRRWSGGQSRVVFYERWKTDCIMARWDRTRRPSPNTGNNSSSETETLPRRVGNWKSPNLTPPTSDSHKVNQHDPFDLWPSIHDLYLLVIAWLTAWARIKLRPTETVFSVSAVAETRR